MKQVATKLNSTLGLFISCTLMAGMALAGFAALRSWADAQCEPRQVEVIARYQVTVWPCMEDMAEPELTRYPSVAACLFGRAQVFDCE
jgi:hypothetical protein